VESGWQPTCGKLSFVCLTAAQVHVPEGLSVLELDTIKLAAQFVARNGKSFLTGERWCWHVASTSEGHGCCAC